MSGQQIGAAVGFVAGFFLPGGPMVWSAIGGAIGGWISPTQVEGPRIGDSANQSSAEGQPITWVLGTCGWIEGNIVDKSEVRDVEKTDDGKGSGVETTLHEAHQDFQIMICESSEIRDSFMVGVLIVQIDGKIVYDMRPESDFAADNVKFLENHTFYDGNEAQLPDPTMEALPHNGVGNTPYYRGVFTMVARDINLTQYGERIPVYRFVMVGAGETETTTITSLVVPPLSGFTDGDFPLADPESDYDLIGYLGVQGVGGSTVSFAGDTIAEIKAYFASYDYTPYGGGTRNPDFYIGYSASTSTSTTPTIGLNIDDFGVSAAVSQPSVVDNASVVLVYNDLDPTAFHPTVNFSGFCFIGSGVEGDKRGTVAHITPTVNGQSALMEVCSPDNLRGYYPLCIRATRKAKAFVPRMGDPCLLGEPTLLPDSPGFVQDCDGNVTPIPTYSTTTGVFRQLQIGITATTGSPIRLTYTQYPVGPVMLVSDPNNNQAYWEAAYDAAVLAGTMDPGKVWNVDYPVASATAYEAEYSTEGLTQDTLGLDTILTRIAIRGGLTADDIDVTEMDQEVMGYMITQNYIGTDCIRPLMTAFISYASEYDAKIRFHKHGEVATMVVDAQDIIQGTEESDQTTREQAVEFPKTYSITYIDPTQNYTARPQVDRRTSSDVRAIGHLQTQVPVVLPPDYARQLSNIGMKVNWARAMGSREFSVPYAGYDTYLELVAGKPFGMDSQRRIASEISLEDGEIKLKGLYDRQSAYTSDITATPAPPPTPPPSNIGGVTLIAILNLPVLRDQDDVVGLYFAVAGLLPAWQGALLQVSADDQVSWQTAIPSMTQQSTIGYLTAALPLAPAEGDDVTNTLSVSVHGGQLNTITRLQFLNEGNPCAIVNTGDTGECEVLSFQDADETASGEYDLTTLSRGGLATDPAAHATGARFTSLDAVYFYQVPSAWIGRTLWFRAVTFGTAPDNNPAYSIVFQPAVSQTEWPIGALEYTDDGTTAIVTATPRHRLGNDLTPIASINFIGYRWTATDGTVTQNLDTTGPSIPITLADFTGPITVTVSALNRITGPGPSMSITL